jgi:hypothetical protein
MLSESSQELMRNYVVKPKNAHRSTLQVKHDMTLARKEGAATPQQIEELSLKVWRTHLANEKRIRAIESELKSIKKDDQA